MFRLLRFISVRLMTGLFTLILVSLIVFGLMELMPGNCGLQNSALKSAQETGNVSQVSSDAEKPPLIAARPFVVRWFNWSYAIGATGYMGKSCQKNISVNQLIKQDIWISFALSLVALLFVYVIAIPLGMIFSASQKSPLGHVSRFAANLSLALPGFLLALIVLAIGAVYFDQSLSGLFSPQYREAAWSIGKFQDFLNHAWLPALLLAWSSMALRWQKVGLVIGRESQSSYVTAARARGITGARLFFQYPARHALGSVVNSLSPDLNRIFSALPLVATVLLLSEAGFKLVEALTVSHDPPVVGAILFLLAMAIIGFDFFCDVILAALDPRIRFGLNSGEQR